VLSRLLLPMLFATGAAGLIYEVVVARLLAQHLGSSGSSQAITLATFLGGLCMGALLAGRAQRTVLPKVRAPLLAYAVLEAGIGLWALLLPSVADLAFGMFAAAAQGSEPGTVGHMAVKLALAATLLLPLAILMGATLPALSFGIARADVAGSVALVSRCYAVNAAGAASGAMAAGFWLVETFGLELPLTLGAVVNLGVAGVASRLLRSSGAIAVEPTADTRAPAGAPRSLLAVAFATGAVALCCEIGWTRLASLLLGASTYSFAYMLGVTIAGIAVGSAIATRQLARGRSAQQVLGLSQGLAGLGTALLVWRADPMAVELAVARARLVPVPENYPLWLLLGGGWLALHLLPAALGLGAAFPALLAAANARGAHTDRATAQLLTWNTLGNLLGALGGGFALLPLLGLERMLGLGAAVSLGLAAVAAGRTQRWMPLVSAGAVLVALAAMPPEDGALTRGLFRMRPHSPAAARREAEDVYKITQLYRKDGKDATIAVDRYADGLVIFRTNGKADGGTGDVTTQVMLGHLGVLVRPRATEALVIGLGTGQTAAALASHAQMHVHAVEMSAAVVQAARFFDKSNDRVLDNPRVRVTVADAREVLAAVPPASLDLVVSEPSNPWIAGIADLYTAESFGRVRDRLRPGGVLVQWIHTYEMADGALRDILCTLQGVLPHVAVFRMDPGDLALVASATPMAFDPTAAALALDAPGVRRHLDGHRAAEVPKTLDAFLATQLAGPATVAKVCQGFAAPLQERFPRLEYSAPRDFFAASAATAMVGRLDTRVGRRPDTWLAEVGPQVSESPARRARLHAFLVAGRHADEAPLHAATAPAGSWPIALAQAVHGLPRVDAVAAADVGRWCAWLTALVPWLPARGDTVLGPVGGRDDWQGWAGRCKQQGR